MPNNDDDDDEVISEYQKFFA